MVRFFLITLVFQILLPVYSLQAQECNASLSGQVIDEHDGQPLPFSNIYFPANGRGTTSDSLGFYSITGICPGTYVVQCSHVGCEPVTDTIKISGNTEHNFYPEHHAELLGLIEINETSNESHVRNRPGIFLEQLEIRKLSLVQGEQIARQLAELKGVTLLNTGNNVSKPVINGLHSNRVIFMNNGVRQEGQQWGWEHAPEIDPYANSMVSVVKGAEALRYGHDPIGGVVLVDAPDLYSRPGLSGRVDMAAHSNGRQGNLSAQLSGTSGKIPGLAFRMHRTAIRSGNFQSPGYFIKNTGRRESNYSLAAGYKREKAGVELLHSRTQNTFGIYSGAHIGNLTDLRNAIASPVPLVSSGFSYKIEEPRQSVDHELIGVKTFIEPSLRHTFKLGYARQLNVREEFDSHDDDDHDEEEEPALRLNLLTHSSELSWEFQPGRKFYFVSGVSGWLQENTYQGHFFIPNYRKLTTGVYSFARFKPDSGKVIFEAALRADQADQQAFLWQGGVVESPSFSYKSFSGSAGLAKELSKHLSAGFSVSTSWRPPSINELFSDGVHHGTAAYEIGDLNLDYEKSLNTALEIIYHPEWLKLGVEIYYHMIRDFIYLQPKKPETVTIRGVFPTFQFEQTNALLTGINAEADLRINKKLLLQNRASLVRGYDRSSGKYLFQMPSDRIMSSIRYEPVITGKLKDAFLELSALKVFRQSRVPQDVDYAPAPDGYSLLNFSAGFYLKTGKEKMLVALTVSNLLNTGYRDYMNRFRYYTDEPGRNIAVRLSIPFNLINKP